MQPAIRAYYNLEELWGAKPVRVRLLPTGPAQAGEPIGFDEDE
jgi:ribosome-associated protein